jgi:hypothetical protein
VFLKKPKEVGVFWQYTNHKWQKQIKSSNFTSMTLR